MDISNLAKIKINSQLTEPQETVVTNKETVEKLDRAFKELAANVDRATSDRVHELASLVTACRDQLASARSPYFRLKNLGLLLKIKGFERKLVTLFAFAEKNKERQVKEKAIWELQKKGLILPLDTESAKDAFQEVELVMKSLGCSLSFTYSINDRELGLLDLLTYTPGDTVECCTVMLGDVHSVPSGIPLSQLQEIAALLDMHGHKEVSLLSSQAIEEKLTKLMKSCPHGAYVLHTADNSLTLSRLTPLGKISHHKIDLQKQLGHYTIQLADKEIAADRLEFKKRLKQSGTPVRLKAE